MVSDDSPMPAVTTVTEFTTVAQLGAIVAARRRELRITQADLAERCGVSRQWMVGFEGGRTSVETGLALRTLRALDLHLELTLTDDPGQASAQQ